MNKLLGISGDGEKEQERIERYGNNNGKCRIDGNGDEMIAPY